MSDSESIMISRLSSKANMQAIDPLPKSDSASIASFFKGFVPNSEANRAVELGARAKSPISGMYTETITDQTFYIKRSNPADDFLEVLFAELATSNIAKCKSVVSNQGEIFVASPRFEGYRAILPKNERGLKKGWLSSNPISEKNKAAIFDKLSTDTQKQDLADILVDCVLFKDDDCQIGNLCFFNEKSAAEKAVVEKTVTEKTVTEKAVTEKNTQELNRVGKIDHGWALADLCSSSANRVINLFDILSPVGKRATHKRGFVPTNHLNDFPKIVNSHFFIRSIAKKIQEFEPNGNPYRIPSGNPKGNPNGIPNGNELLEQKLNTGLNTILSKIPTENNKRIALHQIAGHIKLAIPSSKTTINDIKQYIVKKAKLQLEHRLNSLALNKVLLQIKLNQDENGKRLSPKAKAEALKEVIETRFKGRLVLSFMPSFKPTVANLLGDLIRECQDAHVNPNLIRFCSEIMQGRNPSKRYVRHSISPGKMSDDLNRLATKYQVHRERSFTEQSSDILSESRSRSHSEPVPVPEKRPLRPETPIKPQNMLKLFESFSLLTNKQADKQAELQTHFLPSPLTRQRSRTV